MTEGPAGAEPTAQGPPAGSGASEGKAGSWLASDLPMVRVLGAIVAPTTVLTAILFYFGWSRAYWFYDYLGVDSTLLGLTTQDYLQLSVDGLFVPLTVAACAGLLLLWGRTLLRVRVATPAPGLLVPLMAGAGLLLCLNGVSRIFTETIFNRQLAIAPLSLACGVLLLVYAPHLSGVARPHWVAFLEWAVVFVLVGLSLFWAANDYSAAVGRSRARQFVAELPNAPDAVVYSARSLSLRAPSVRESRCQDPDAAYRFRYDGLKLVLRSGDQYLLLPRGWSRENGVALLLPMSDSLRLEFSPASVPEPARRPAC
ncbi:hypothetical protein [Nonomuraea lactucae]|uniref:hypothetical protein n=1 Tax=Nonomuraea lactucae TaxID=2249762 RepID=UPI000DE246FB|nr:hypothetical protein [Nonomuraea lactucae]